MVSEENKVAEEEVSLSKYLKPDTPEILKIKSLYNLEYKYSEWLGTIEYAIADYYSDNRKLQDKNVVLALKHIKKNYEKDISFFKDELEKAIVEDLLEVLEKSPLTHHEFILALDYILWVIDNRSWIKDKQAYVKWISYILDFFSEEEEDKYEKQFKRQTRKMGVSDAQADMLLMKRNDQETFDFEDELFEGQEEILSLEMENVADDLETGFFLMTDEEKFNFLLEHGPDYIELVQSYALELAEKNDFKRLMDFYKKLNEKEKNFYPLHFIMGTIYLEKDPTFAKSCFQEILRISSKDREIPDEMNDFLRQNIDILEKLIDEENKEEKQTEKQTEKKTRTNRKDRSRAKTSRKSTRKTEN